MKEYIEIFQRLGLKKEAALIYHFLIEHPESSLSDIVRTQAIHRTQIYRLLPSLFQLELIYTREKGKRKYYFAHSPLHLKKLLEHSRMQEDISLEKLQKEFEKEKKEARVIYKKWVSGIHESFYDIIETLPHGWEFFRISSEVDIWYINNNFIPRDYRTKRDKKQIERSIILSQKAARAKKPKLERDIKILPQSQYDFDDNIMFTIYGEKFSFFDFQNELSIRIESPEIAKFLEKIFRALFSRLP